MRKKNDIKKRLKNGESVIGTWCTIPSPSVVNIIGTTGIDFVIIDMEHGHFSFETVENCVRSADSENCHSFIRVQKNDESLITNALDTGSQGVVIPHIESFQDAKNAISYSKYHPIGMRGFTPYTRTGGYSKNNIEQHAEQENKETMIILIIEGIKGIKNIESIIDQQHIDVIYIGQYDLSQAIGKPGKINDKEVVKYIEKYVKKINEKGIAVGSLAHNINEIKLLNKLGIQFITYYVDCAIIYNSFDNIVKKFNKII